MDRIGNRPNEDSKICFRFLIFLCWILALTSFNLPNRIAPPDIGNLDWVAFFKIGMRIFAFSVLLLLFFKISYEKRFKSAFIRLLPFGLFGLWCLISTIWSPLKVVSLGHGGELSMLILFSGICGTCCNSNERFSALLLNISLIIFIFVLLSVILYYKYPSSGVGLTNRPDALGHPNDVAGSAGLGIILIAIGISAFHWRWAYYILIPAVIVEGLFLYIAQSRVALAGTFVAFALTFVIFQKRIILSLSIFVVCSIVIGIISFSVLDPILSFIGSYILRDQEVTEFLNASGRLELWSKGITFFTDSPLLGNGYYAFSPTGVVDVGLEARPIGAHNLVLHVLTGTGLIGAVLLGWGLLRLFVNIARVAFTPNHSGRNNALIILIVFVWFFLIGFFELSFLGPIRISTLIFFILIGIGATVNVNAKLTHP
jgi:O-antigen ligase